MENAKKKEFPENIQQILAVDNTLPYTSYNSLRFLHKQITENSNQPSDF